MKKESPVLLIPCIPQTCMHSNPFSILQSFYSLKEKKNSLKYYQLPFPTLERFHQDLDKCAAQICSVREGPKPIVRGPMETVPIILSVIERVVKTIQQTCISKPSLCSTFFVFSSLTYSLLFKSGTCVLPIVNFQFSPRTFCTSRGFCHL